MQRARGTSPGCQRWGDRCKRGSGQVRKAFTERHHRAPVDAPCGIVDNVNTRAIANALAADAGGINLAEAHESLRRLLGNGYDANLWGSLLDKVHCEPGEEPAMTVDQAFQFAAVPDVGPDTHAKSMEAWRNTTKGYL